MEITKYLSAKLIQIPQQRSKSLVVAWASECKATQRDVSHLQSSQEEADTKMILHALDAASNGATEINVFSLDTDVFVLLLRRCYELCTEVHFVTGTGQRRRVIKLRPIAQTLGRSRLAALPVLHAISGADVTGSFANKGKLTWWKIFKDADEATIDALSKLGTKGLPTADTMAAIEKLVCRLYVPNTQIKTVSEL